ncbi:MAG: PIG-L family deacetylase [Bacteroidetes Order II. Incertae sedis bacterium]|nr:PIG-L family deacetylase [Bacteroidetes Order II. bacterium]
MRISLSFVLFIGMGILSNGVFAQYLPQLPEKKLVVMNVAAHPDDEDGQTMAYYRHAKNAVVYSIIYTRGEGGQNEIGPELYEELGALRTQETEKAARILGTKVYFLNYPDFGFSKFAKEAFEKWGGKEAVIARIVYMVRKLKPDVMFTNHDTVTVGSNRQHGQHQAVGISALAAFRLAADPTFHPEQLHEPGVSLWQPKRFFWRNWMATSGEVQIAVSDPYKNDLTYQQLALNALKEHASQGMDFFAGRRSFPRYTFFRLIDKAADEALHPTDLAGNLETIARRADLSYYLDAGNYFSPINVALVNRPSGVATPGEKVVIQVPGNATTSLKIWMDGVPISLQNEEKHLLSFQIPKTAQPSYPKITYQYQRFSNAPVFTYAVIRQNRIESAGYLPLEIAPVLYLDPVPPVLRIHGGENSFTFKGQNFDPSSSRFQATFGFKTEALHATKVHQAIETTEEGSIKLQVSFVAPKDLPDADYPYNIELVGMGSKSGTNRSGTMRVLEPFAMPGLHVGVIKSYDDTLPMALKELGVSYKMLDSLDLSEKKFSGLQTIVVDIRAYFVRKDLRTYNQHLLNWVKEGGTLIVQYQKTFEWNAGETDPLDPTKKNPETTFAPFPIRLGGRDRVTYEDAPIRMLQPSHVLFRKPNQITEEDWEGWIQERGLYFPNQYDPAYTELFEMADPNEKPQRGSTLLATYGQGKYLFTALSWYRQLQALHPGAFRLFANMISLPFTQED